MFQLDIDVKMTIEVPDEFNARLEQGESAAFADLEDYLKYTLNRGNQLMPRQKESGEYGFVSRLQVDDAGQYNVVFDVEPPSKR